MGKLRPTRAWDGCVLSAPLAPAARGGALGWPSLRSAWPLTVGAPPRRAQDPQSGAHGCGHPCLAEEHLPAQAAPESPGPEDTGMAPLERLWNVRQLEALARAYTLLALVVSPSAADYEDYCLMAYTFLKRIWQVRREAAPPWVPGPWQESVPPPCTHRPHRLVQPLGGVPSPTAVAKATLLRSPPTTLVHPPRSARGKGAQAPACGGDGQPMLASACPSHPGTRLPEPSSVCPPSPPSLYSLGALGASGP